MYRFLLYSNPGGEGGGEGGGGVGGDSNLESLL